MAVDEALDAVFQASEAKHARRAGHESAGPAEVSRRIREQLLHAPDAIEMQIGTNNQWEQLVLLGLFKRYGLKAYRYRKQRQTTIMAHVNRQRFDDVLWPIFLDVRSELH